jgi:hypothetical protein
MLVAVFLPEWCGDPRAGDQFSRFTLIVAGAIILLFQNQLAIRIGGAYGK